tara:strand:- start:41671 stop:43221 length:1551 start_codon:yes stop_codon:yes gene_type:complete
MSVISPTTQLLLSLSMLKGVGPASLKKTALIPGFGEQAIEDLANKIPQIARALSGEGSWRTAQDDAAKQIADAELHHARILSPFDSEYPQLLAATKDDPFILYVQGSLSPSTARSVAIIGTRDPTAHGKVIATRITQFFAERNWSIVSGLAIGCDAIAHQAALDANCHTVAVLAHGLHMIAPAKHKKLAEGILAGGGALVSEYPFGQNVQSQQYVKRDRTQAGMAQGVVMIQAGLKGGSLHASRASLDYGRWLAVPYPTDKDCESGAPNVQANLLIAEGTDTQRAGLLRCHTNSLKHTIILRSREDYFLMTEQEGEEAPGSPSPRISGGQLHAKPLFSEHPEVIDAVLANNIQTADRPESRGVAQTPEAVELEVTRDIVLDELHITQMPPVTSKDFKKAAAFVKDAGIIVELSARFQYIQAEIDAIGKIRFDNEGGVSKENRFSILFSVEGILSQIKRSADVLISIESRNGDSRQEAFNYLLTLCSQPVKSGDVLNKAVRSFNELIKKTFYTGPEA